MLHSLNRKTLSPHSHFRKWVDVTRSDMWTFFGLIIAMDLIMINDLDEYWCMDSLFCLPLFRAVMKRNRFCLIFSFLHICDNEQQRPRGHSQHDPLFKIRHFVDNLTANFKHVFVPGKNIAIDEAMVAWRGLLSFLVYNPDKFGIKVFQLCDSTTGYCSNLEFYTGKKQCSPHGATFDVVDRLIAPFLGCGRTLFVDNYYTSPDLFTYLNNNNTRACGTMRVNRKNGPPKGMMPKLKKGDTTSYALKNGTLNLLRFFDKREVNILTTCQYCHDSSRVLTGKTCPVNGEAIVKLQAVNEYNKYMVAVDRSDQMVSYNVFKRRALKWWKKAFFHTFMLEVLNSYTVHKVTSVKSLTHRLFRRELAKQLIEYTVIPQILPVNFALPLVTSPSPFNRNLMLGNRTRNCVVCSGPVRKQSRYECRSCDVGLCVEPCFEIYHTMEDFKRAVKRQLAQ